MFKLKNRSIITTSPASNNDKLAEYLVALGAEVFSMPVISIKPAKLTVAETKIIKNTDNYDVIVFTSKNGIKNFFAHKDASISKQTKTAVIGNTTAAELLNFGQMPSFINAATTAAEFSEELKDIIKPGENILLILGNLAPDILNKSISLYANVTRINVYKTANIKDFNKEVLELIEEDDYDVLLFSSPSAVRSIQQKLSKSVFAKLKAASIGPSTARTMNAEGLKPLFVAEKSTSLGFANATEEYLS